MAQWVQCIRIEMQKKKTPNWVTAVPTNTSTKWYFGDAWCSCSAVHPECDLRVCRQKRCGFWRRVKSLLEMAVWLPLKDHHFIEIIYAIPTWIKCMGSGMHERTHPTNAQRTVQNGLFFFWLLRATSNERRVHKINCTSYASRRWASTVDSRLDTHPPRTLYYIFRIRL